MFLVKYLRANCLMKKWLNDNIHCHGSRLTADELVQKVTCRPLVLKTTNYLKKSLSFQTIYPMITLLHLELPATNSAPKTSLNFSSNPRAANPTVICRLGDIRD